MEKKLRQNVEHGEQAEKFAFEYEKQRLMQLGINKKPLSISSVDVMAGYDMVSYQSICSDNYDRFIEVKAVSRSGFYWSKNEYETARLKTDKYYLYLVDLNRVNEPEYAPEIIQNPAVTVMQTDGWFVEAQSFYIKRV